MPDPARLDDEVARPADPLQGLAQALAARLSRNGRPRKELRAAVGLALEFWTWRRLADEGLSDRDAAKLMAELALRVATAR